MQQLREKVQSLQEDLRETQLCEKTNAATAQQLDQQILHLEKERSQLKLQLADAQLELADAQLHIADAREEAQKEASKCVRQEKLVKDLAEAKLCASKFRYVSCHCMNCTTTVRYWSEQYAVKTSVTLTLYALGLSRMILMN